MPIILLASFTTKTDNPIIPNHLVTLDKPLRLHQLQHAMKRALGLIETTPQVQETKEPRSQESKSQTTYRLLVVEDNLVNQKVTTKMLKTLGHTIDIAGNGIEALKALDTMTYDLIFMDCQMPVMDGFEATKNIRTLESEKLEVRNKEHEADLTETPPSLLLTTHRSRVPIIALTANALIGDREQCMEAGMDDFLSKPAKIEELQAIIQRWLPQPDNDLASISSSKKAETKMEAPMTPATHSEDTPPSLNPATLEDLRALGGEDDPDFFAALIDQFLEDIPRHVTAIQAALDQEDPAALQKAAHACKGGARYMGAERLADLSFQLEQFGRQGTLLTAQDLTVQLAQEAATIAQLLKNENLVRSP